MSASAAFANDILNALLIDGDFGAIVIGLHTADPGAAGTQATSEVAYTGYARRPAAVGATNWTVSGNAFQNATPIEFPEATAVSGTVTITHFTIGNATSGAGKVLLRGKLANPLTINVGTEPRFKVGTLVGTVDTSAPV